MTDVCPSGPLKEKIGRYGVWNTALRQLDPAGRPALADALQELEESGYGAIWIGGSPSLRHAEVVVEETSRVPVGTSITTIWDHEAPTVARQFAELERAHPGRFLLGLGVSHAHFVADGRYRRPYSALSGYLDGLDTAGVPAGRRLLAALGPKMLKLARDRAAGALPYFTTVEHTAQARETLGPAPLLAPEVKVLLETDPARARAIGRGYLPSTATPSYNDNLLRSGFTEDDLADGGSDRLVDALIAWGDEERVKARLDEFFAAGADHVAIQVLAPDRSLDVRHLAEGQPIHPVVRDGWRRLAAVLF